MKMKHLIVGLTAIILVGCGDDTDFEGFATDGKPLFPELCKDQTYTVCDDTLLCPDQTVVLTHEIDCLNWDETKELIEGENDGK